MAWSKLKNIVLLLLAMTDLALLSFVVQREYQDERMRRQARDSAIAFLAERGVNVEEGLVPQTMTLAPQIVERDREQEGEAAAALLKGAVEEESRGGEVYRYYNGSGSVQFHSDGAFSAELSPGAYPLGEDRERTCLEVLALLGFQGELVEEAEDSLTFRQLWEGSPLFTQQVTLTCGDGCLTGMTGGRRLVGAPAEDAGRTSITVPTALFDFYNGLKALGDVCSRIDGITQGFVGAASLSGPMELTPVWRITTDTGAYQIDLLTGALSRAA